MHGVLDLAVDRFKVLDAQEREVHKALLVNFRNLYAFLSQVIPYQDSDLEQLYTYLRFLLTKLPRRVDESTIHLNDDVALQYYRLQKMVEAHVDLTAGDSTPLKGPGDVGTGQKDEAIRLSELIELLNQRFGTHFTLADQLFFDQIQEEAQTSDALRLAAQSNSKTDFRYVFEKAFEGLVIDRMDGNEDIFAKLMGDAEFRKLTIEHLLHKVYTALRDKKI
jgi:type I restriction enzyme R subunit